MRTIVPTLTLLVLFGAAVSSAADERPIVQVKFVFDGNTCSRYGATRDAEGERFAQIVAREFAKEFQFARWRTKAKLFASEDEFDVRRLPNKAEEATLTLQFRAQDEQRGRRRGVAYYIDYFRDVDMNGAKLPARDRAMSSYIGRKAPLYEWDSFARPCGEDANFTALLVERIDDDIKVFRQDWIDNLMRYVPIMKVVPNADATHDQAVTLDVHWKPLHTGLTSHLQLNVGGDVKAFLNPIAIHDDRQSDPVICAHVISLKDAAGVTRALIRNVLQTYKTSNYIRVFMTHYELARNTHNYTPPVIPHPD